MLVYLHQQVQDAWSGSVESMRSPLADTRQELITCQSSGSLSDHLDLPLSEPPPDQCHVQNDRDGDEYQDEEISDEDFWVSLVSSCAYSIFAKLEH